MESLCGVDIGGTFTDLYYCDENGKVIIAKTPTIPENPEKGFINVMLENALNLSKLNNIIHGTTLATNAIIEKKYSKLALITTKGFKDLIEIGRYHRPELYNFNQQKERPLVKRRYTYEVIERIGGAGEIIEDFDEESAIEIIEQINKDSIKNVAICFINSYCNDVNEKKMRDLLLKKNPEVYCSISSEVLPKIGTLGRLIGTMLNVGLKEIIEKYITLLEDELKANGYVGNLWLMQSNGGSVQANKGSRFGEKTILSGPAGGVIGASYMGKRSGFNRLITLDIGGTSTDMSIIEDANPLVTDNKEIGWDMPLPIPMIDITTIGAGGGSIAWIDDQGIPKVGPKSAGAKPGPAFYGLGNDKPTLSDAALMLGYLNKSYYAGKKVDLSIEASYKALAWFGNQLDMDVYNAAKGIVNIVNVNTGNAIKEILIKRGKDPREYTLFAFGGAGPVFASAIARELSIPQVLVSPFSGVFSAFGLLCGGIKHDVVKSFYLKTNYASCEDINDNFKQMESELTSLLNNEGFGEEKILIEKYASLRYEGQNYDLEVPITGEFKEYGNIKKIESDFIKKHKEIYGVIIPDTETVFLGLRVTGTGLMNEPTLPYIKDLFKENNKKNGTLIKGEREVHFLTSKKPIKTPIYDGNLFYKAAIEVEGPAIIESSTTTVVIEPDNFAQVDSNANIIITIGGKNG